MSENQIVNQMQTRNRTLNLTQTWILLAVVLEELNLMETGLCFVSLIYWVFDCYLQSAMELLEFQWGLLWVFQSQSKWVFVLESK